MIPDIATIEALHKKYAPHQEAYDLVYGHCQIVRDIAMQLLEVRPQPGINRDLVEAGSLLHDIGVYSLYKDGDLQRDAYVSHGVLGDDILKNEGFDEAVCRIASHHTGAGITREDVIKQQLPLPKDQDFLAETDEERLVMYADKFHSKTPKFNTLGAQMKHLAQFGDQHPKRLQALADEFGVPDLAALSQQYQHPIV